MTIRHDRSYLPADIDWLIENGYAEEDLHSLRFQISVADMSVEDANYDGLLSGILLSRKTNPLYRRHRK